MRKQDFPTSNPEFTVENTRVPIVEGGAMPGVGAFILMRLNPTGNVTAEVRH